MIWFVRGTTLYRRQLLVTPGVSISTEDNFYRDYDLSVHRDPVSDRLVANSLGDLTRPERRFAYNPDPTFPGPPCTVQGWDQLGFPTLCECSSNGWTAGQPLPSPNVSPRNKFDAWYNPNPWAGVDPATGHLYYNPGSPQPGQRVSEDVILTNVIGFDVKVWDPGANNGLGMYVDLGDNSGFGDQRHFNHTGHPDSGLAKGANTGQYCIYDTYSLHYEYDGPATDGFDSNGNGVVDDVAERQSMPPYPVPLRGIQVKIRVVERDSRQIREVTVVQDFLPK